VPAPIISSPIILCSINLFARNLKELTAFNVRLMNALSRYLPLRRTGQLLGKP